MTPAFLLAALSVGAPAEPDYLRDIKPLLMKKCDACHGAVRQKAGLRLDAASLILKGNKRGPVVVPGKPDESRLMEMVADDPVRMPPKGAGEHLSAKEIELFQEWIRHGAKMPDEPIPPGPKDHWAYQTPKRPAVPRRETQATNPIDAFLDVERQKHHVPTSPEADKPTLLRRVYLDLIGVPPTPDDLHAFLQDNSPDAYEKVVDRLLRSPMYGERWGRHWMDVWRYSDPFGLGEEYRYSQRHIWRWRDWIIDSLNADKGYDRMILEMLAGDEIAPADRDTLRATGYLARNWYKFNRTVWLQDTAEYTAAGFLGITMRCCRCHDHKYDPISQQDYYRFRAFFEPHDVRIDPVPGQPDVLKDGIARAFDAKPSEPTYLFVRGDERMADKSKVMSPGVPGVLGPDPAVTAINFGPKDFAPLLPEAAAGARRLATAELGVAEEAAKKANDAVAEAKRRADHQATLAFIAGSATRIDVADARLVQIATLANARLAAGQATADAVEARIAADTSKLSGAAEATWKPLALAAGKAERKAAALQAASSLLALEQASPTDKAKIAAAKKAKEAADAAAAKEDSAYTPLVPMNPTTSTGRRLALAKWIADAKNPLTARVAVNHIWMRHFGTPLVPTVANFGLNGKPPTHPELLDWLAVEFTESGWSMKHLHRLIVTSRAYRLSSRMPDKPIDPENRYYGRINPRRMEAEVVRDSLLAVARQLDPTIGGPIIDEKQGQTSRRRSVYFRFNTEYKMQFLDQFDAASPTECYERRESIIPQQALALHNSPLALNMTRELAGQLAVRPTDAPTFVTTAFEHVLSRSPTAEERTRCESFLREQAALYQKPDRLTSFPPGPAGVTPPSPDPARRAREDLIQVLLNHNDVVTIR
jgi:hypothetical protein